MSRDVGCFFRLRTRLLLPNPIHICWCIRQLRLKVYEQSLLLLKTVVKGETETRVSFLEGGDFYSFYFYVFSVKWGINKIEALFTHFIQGFYRLRDNSLTSWLLF